MLALTARGDGRPGHRRDAQGGTPWHAHHIAERYGLFTIIALGEGVVGTVASLSAVVGEQGWSVEAVFVGGRGHRPDVRHVVDRISSVPPAEILHAHRERSFWFGYLHIVVYASIVATGAGLHAAAYYIEHHSELGSVATVLSVVDPGRRLHPDGLRALRGDDAHRPTVPRAAARAVTAAVLGLAVLLAANGVSMANCLLVVTLAPVVTVVGYELVGHRHAAQACRAGRGGA